MALGDDIKKGKIEAQEFKQIIMDLDSTLKSLAVTFSQGITEQTAKATEEAKKLAASYSNDLTKGITASEKALEDIENIQEKLNQGQKLSISDRNKINKAERDQLVTLRKIEQAKQEGIKLDAEDLVALEENFKKQNKVRGAIEARAEAQEKSLGAVGKISSAVTGLLDKLGMGGLNKFFNLDKANAESKKTLENLGDSATAGQKISTVTTNIFKNLDKSALAAGGLFKLAGFLFDQFKKADQSTTDIARGLSMSKKEAKEFKKEMKETSGSFLSTAVSIKEQKKALMALNKELGGTAIAFDKGILEGAAESLNRLHLSEEAIGNMAKQAMRTGKTFKELEKEQAAGVLAAEKEFGIRLKLSDVLDEANKMSALTRINLDKFPGGLTKAVALSKQLGVNMDAINGAADQLLDFESSIRAEMAAEAVLGRDLNLEKARSLALDNDMAGLMKELVVQAGSLEELQGMNRIQQQDFAAALGISTEELAEQLETGESLATQADAQLDRDAQEALNNEKMLSLQEKQTLAMEKFSETIQMLGPLLLVAAAAAAAIAIAASFGTATPLVVGGILATAAAVGGITAMVEDGIAPPGSGPFKITDKFGATTITAAGDGLAVSPNINTTGGAGGNADMKETNALLSRILNKEGTVKMNSTQVGTAFSVNTRQIQ